MALMLGNPQKVVIHLCVKLRVFAVSMVTAGILKFYPIPSTLNDG
jgi:Na+/citrate or Na+/malate symporter